MKRTTAVLLGIAATGFGAASFASTYVVPSQFGAESTEIVLEDARLNADNMFDKIDVNGDGLISIDEYASQAVVNASLSRFNGVVAIDGRQTFHITLPNEATGRLASYEQTTIDAIARNEFYAFAGSDSAMDRREWIAAKLNDFAEVDFNEDGRLSGPELEVYTLNIARFQTSVS
ncbi:hypothetical protein FF098_005890 [Parvularcula flava]|uniref:EF-hand domain-containing protein n=1 Tax=Aquisalinus luteolus TaxID=1566827 RepID=A0A8J3A6V5_9PROT|nr:EF-hand domain-containing protein [Aquisalinus luteolus]NHK27431.1 hypothetical protein [Aquisalinus luteolus]GGH95417.1 hypothetical protein GCM10011355_11910 [Aquisalinus luteolus]